MQRAISELRPGLYTIAWFSYWSYVILLFATMR